MTKDQEVEPDMEEIAEDGSAEYSDYDAFMKSILSIAVAQIIQQTGFQTTQTTAVTSLVEIMTQYIRRIGASCKEIAEISGRTTPCITDALQAFEDTIPAQVTLKDLMTALQRAHEPFCRDLPEFPLPPRDNVESDHSERYMIGKRDELPPHVPPFMPPLPSRHTYSTRRRNVITRESDEKQIRLGLFAQKREFQQSLNNLLGGVSQEEVSKEHSWTASVGHAKKTNETSKNPFIAPPKKKLKTNVCYGEVFHGLAREFKPANETESAHRPVVNDAQTLDKMQRQEMGKEERILSGTFHDGDSE